MTLLDLMADADRPAFEFPAASTSTAPKPALNRTFWRCADCLAVMAVDGEPTTAKLTCGGCGGSCECMGRVERQRLRNEKWVCPCDGRCTGATGPACDCTGCHGANHGTGRLVRVTVDAGGIPKITPVSVLTSQHQAAEYREALAGARDRLRAQYGKVLDAKNRGEYVRDYGLYCAALHAYGALRRAQALRTHAGRLKALKKL